MASHSSCFQSKGPKTVTAKTKIQSKSRKEKKKARKKALNATDLSRCKPDRHRGAEIYSATRISRRRCGDLCKKSQNEQNRKQTNEEDKRELDADQT
jgi:hypothetical protein